MFIKVVSNPIALTVVTELIGATYFISREANLAIIAERFCIDSDESRDAMGIYICGSLFGTIYRSLPAFRAVWVFFIRWLW